MATLLGAGISTATALIVFTLNQKSERKKRDEERKRLEAGNAISGHIKLTQWANLLANIQSHIDRFYEEASQDDLQVYEPYQIVGPTAGLFLEPERLKAEEFAFLISEKESELISNMLLVEARASNTHHLLNEYSKQRLAFEEWLENLPGFKRELVGRISKESIPIEHKTNWDLRIAQLNVILGNIIENIEDDILLAENTTNEFARIAHHRFDDHFPEITLNSEPS
ncbi:hypothetical protein K3X13_04765 [Aliiroseovarius crassostreae]|uniref:hypothetical protein n=1 Tax=Aliiroseovarius crassostreae TaxID=154981 RepID=UPI0021FB5F7E|nr:hypothetical protein [Aliiroseovarius crassostreae]UWP93157.1 hypothetical protein K3X13_04765 [Aliiroseovarius crassostreae]